MEAKRKTSNVVIGSIILLLTALTAYFLVRAIITLISPSSAWVPVPQNAASTGPAPQHRVKNVSLTFDPFYRNAAPEVVADNASLDTPETTLNLTLRGVTSGENGRAIIETADGQQSSFAVGDEIINDVVLDSIYKDYVVLSLNGRKEKLPFASRDTENTIDGVIPAFVPPPRQFADASQFDADDIFKKVSVRRVNENGRIKGYKIRSRQPGVDLSQMGLQDGDILVKLGNMDLTVNGGNWVSGLQQMSVAGGGTAEIIRDGRTMTVRMTLR